MYVYLPDKKIATGMSVLIFPGGGFRFINIDADGHTFSNWLNKHGIAAFIVQYRLPNGNFMIPMTDAIQAMKLVHKHSAEWCITTELIGVAGFSIGGHTASYFAIHAEQPLRPAFQLLLYPVISMLEDRTYIPTRNNFMGISAESANCSEYSNELHVKNDTPPAFIAHSDDDSVVSPMNSVWYYKALKQHNIPASLYIFPTGGHAWSMSDSFVYCDLWLDLLKHWMQWFVVYRSSGKCIIASC